ncbi:DUF739 family protein [Anaerotignum sp. MB30-C6]|uniref:DUF739 family protein n=1 Tax=Anaerotignum sp. MB30-C6 TaxID=3070814 RepID=UPI0027DCAEBB|nr:DUF739 family protein [Anaerotignum sp. MB30-C6]WMI81568.1 DUF739 family protein [Anaerotignum sp. MB30-C6]
MSYNYGKLKGRIVERFGTQAQLARKIGLSERTLSLKLNGKVNFTQSDIEIIVEALSINREDIQSYFFEVIAQCS